MTKLYYLYARQSQNTHQEFSPSSGSKDSGTQLCKHNALLQLDLQLDLSLREMHGGDFLFTIQDSALRQLKQQPAKDSKGKIVKQKKQARLNFVVDKSGFIRQIIEVGDQSTLIVRPRRFGKTHNLTMARQFFSPTYELINYSIQPVFGINENAVFFQGGSKLDPKSNIEYHYKKMSIAEDQDFFNQHYGMHPVIFLSFKDIAIGQKSDENFVVYLKRQIQKVYEENRYLAVASLMNNSINNKQLKQMIQTTIEECRKKQHTLPSTIQILYNNMMMMNIPSLNILKKTDLTIRTFIKIDSEQFWETDYLLYESLLSLVKIMQQFYKGKKVIVLVDQYDGGIMRKLATYFQVKPGKIRQKKRDDIQKSSLMISSLLSTIAKGADDFILKVIMMGVTEVLTSNGFSDFNSVEINSLGFYEEKSAKSFEKCFGFTQEQVKKLLKEVAGQLNFDSEKEIELFQQIKTHYNGYEEGETCIFTPWSVVKHVRAVLCKQRQQPLPKLLGYWQNSGTLSLLQKLPNVEIEFDILDKLEKISTCNTISFANTYNFLNWKASRSINVLLNCCDQTITEEVILFLFIRSGYIVQTYNKAKGLFQYRLTNKQVQAHFKNCITRAWICKKFKLTLHSIGSLIKKVMKVYYSPKKLQDLLQKQLLSKLTPGDKSEADFNRVLRGLFQLAHFEGFSFDVFSQFTVNGKRIDLITMPTKQDQAKQLVIFEFEKGLKHQNQVLEAGLFQVFGNDYLQVAFNKDVQSRIFETVAVRSVAFMKNSTSNEWRVAIRQQKFQKSTLKNVQGLFSMKNLQNVLKLINKPVEQQIQSKVRTIFVESIPYSSKAFLQYNGVNSLNDLIANWLVFEDNNQPQKEQIAETDHEGNKGQDLIVNTRKRAGAQLKAQEVHPIRKKIAKKPKSRKTIIIQIDQDQ